MTHPTSAPRGLAFIVSAPSGAGKTSLVSALLESTANLELSVSHTTRAPRDGEENGRHYHFVDRATFEAEIAAGHMLEHADVFGNLYGTSRRFVEERLREGRDVVLEIDWQGARLAREQIAGALSIMVLPPSREVLAERLRRRGKDSDTVIAGRLAAAREEMSHMGEFDHIVINDEFDHAAAELRAIVMAARTVTARQISARRAMMAALLAQ